MRKIILGIIVIAQFSFSGNNLIKSANSKYSHNLDSKSKTEVKVYICNGPKSYAYHSYSTCSGLNNCSTEISEVQLSTAHNKGRRACKKCY